MRCSVFSIGSMFMLLSLAGELPALELKAPEAPFAKTENLAVQEKSSFTGDSIVSGTKTLLWPDD